MSARHGMSCESCRDLLMELVCDELDTETGAAVRAHALTCERCGPELSKLERTLAVGRDLPLLSPSPEVERRIMQAARDAIAGRAKGLARETSSAPKSSLSAWFARLGTWAMSPQVAMASVLLLVVGIGLYALPIGHAPQTTALRETDEDAAGHVAPAASATAAPAPQTADDVQGAAPRTEREQKMARQAELAADSPAEKSTRARKAAKPSKSAGGAAYDALEDSLGGLEAPIAKKELRRPAESAQRDLSMEGSGKGGFAQPPPAPAAPERASAPKAAAEESEYAPVALAPRGSAKDDRADDLARGIKAAQGGEYGLSRELLQPFASTGTPSERAQANLWLARGYKAAGDCAGALPYYRVLTQSPSVARAVLEEAAECFERTGNQTQASKLRARAGLAEPARKSSAQTSFE